MEIKYEIPDNMVECFTKEAKDCLLNLSEKYTIDIISEAEATEQIYQVQGASKEITHSNVLQATKTYRINRKKSKLPMVLGIIGEFLLFISGIMFLPDIMITVDNKLNLMYLIIWVVILLIAFTVTICSHLLGGD